MAIESTADGHYSPCGPRRAAINATCLRWTNRGQMLSVCFVSGRCTGRTCLPQMAPLAMDGESLILLKHKISADFVLLNVSPKYYIICLSFRIYVCLNFTELVIEWVLKHDMIVRRALGGHISLPLV